MKPELLKGDGSATLIRLRYYWYLFKTHAYAATTVIQEG